MIGLGTYSYFWQLSDRMPTPLTLIDVLDRAAAHQVGVFQICDYPRITELSTVELEALRGHGIRLELGTRGTAVDHLTTYLRLAEALDVTLVRSMLDPESTVDDAQARLRRVLPDYERAGVTLALETYERVPVRELVRVVESIGSAALGICLDPANGVAALDLPRDTVELCAPYVRDVHVKDFAFTRSEGWVGFQLTGAPLGTGLLDYAHLARTVEPERRGLSQIVEHWLGWQGDPATTAAEEERWTATALQYLRNYQKEHSP
jgi:sugar phosphate isomerase/epimerase